MRSEAAQFNPGLALFSKLVCVTTLGLIFAGGVVTSKNVGLAVPDWPTSYGYHMWGLPFSMWKGGVLYEHFHRVFASATGLLVLVIAVWLHVSEKRKAVRWLGIACLVAVLTQGILGGITVRLTLPLVVSVAHAVLAQIFLCLTIVLAYSLSREHFNRVNVGAAPDASFLRRSIFLVLVILLQLVVAAYMRHDMKHQGGVAIPDFPTVTEKWFPRFDDEALGWVNSWRSTAVWEHNATFEIAQPVRSSQMAVHFAHRILAFVLVALCLAFSVAAYRHYRGDSDVLESFYILDALIGIQVILGIFVVWSNKGELVTTLHVMIGAASLGAAVLLALRAAPSVEVT
jgi:cytochrome c oxidase assembly protein subunit 15